MSDNENNNEINYDTNNEGGENNNNNNEGGDNNNEGEYNIFDENNYNEEDNNSNNGNYDDDDDDDDFDENEVKKNIENERQRERERDEDDNKKSNVKGRTRHTKPANIVKIIVISDTHGKHKFVNLPQCDVLIHCGDFTNKSTERKVKSFGHWLHQQKATTKVVVYGNHEQSFRREQFKNEWLKEYCPEVHILDDSYIETRDFYIFGRGFPFKNPTKDIPYDKPLIVCSHEPPYDACDTMVVTKYTTHWQKYKGGSHIYRKFIEQRKPGLACCGHSHYGKGIGQVDKTLVVNAAMVSEWGIPETDKYAIVTYADGVFTPHGYGKNEGCTIC